MFIVLFSCFLNAVESNANAFRAIFYILKHDNNTKMAFAIFMIKSNCLPEGVGRLSSTLLCHFHFPFAKRITISVRDLSVTVRRDVVHLACLELDLFGC